MLDVVQPRRGFLRGLVSLPLVGGVALSGPAILAGEEPTKAISSEQPATLEDYAAADFEALEVDLQEALAAHREMWTPLAFGLKLLTKSPDECRDLAGQMENDGDTVKCLLGSLADGAAWFKQAAELIESAEVRFLCGAARSIKEDEIASGGLDA